MATTITKSLVFLLQTCDTAFPTGAYAHSQGLEEMVRAGGVADEDGLRQFLLRHVIPAATHVDLPIVREAREAAKAEDFSGICEINRLAGALRVARELREASLQTGRRRLVMLSRVRPTAFLGRMQAEAERVADFGHHAVVWGAACAEQTETDALAAYFYQTLSSFCSASPKLFRIGQEGAQRVLSNCLEQVERAVEVSRGIVREDIGWFDPVLDIASMRHEIADERLFIS